VGNSAKMLLCPTKPKKKEEKELPVKFSAEVLRLETNPSIRITAEFLCY